MEVLQIPNTQNNAQHMSVFSVLLTQMQVFDKPIQTATLQYMRNKYEVLTLVVEGEMQKLKKLQLHFTRKMSSFHSWWLRSWEHLFCKITSIFQEVRRWHIYLHTKNKHNTTLLVGRENELHFLKCIMNETSLYVICEELSTAIQSTKYNLEVMGSVIN